MLILLWYYQGILAHSPALDLTAWELQILIRSFGKTIGLQDNLDQLSVFEGICRTSSWIR